ncbi:hypothetical protein D3C83_155290 [compost metagenome]
MCRSAVEFAPNSNDTEVNEVVSMPPLSLFVAMGVSVPLLVIVTAFPAQAAGLRHSAPN